jgi:hypothetical protein
MVDGGHFCNCTGEAKNHRQWCSACSDWCSEFAFCSRCDLARYESVRDGVLALSEIALLADPSARTLSERVRAAYE